MDTNCPAGEPAGQRTKRDREIFFGFLEGENVRLLHDHDVLQLRPSLAGVGTALVDALPVQVALDDLASLQPPQAVRPGPILHPEEVNLRGDELAALVHMPDPPEPLEEVEVLDPGLPRREAVGLAGRNFLLQFLFRRRGHHFHLAALVAAGLVEGPHERATRRHRGMDGHVTPLTLADEGTALHHHSRPGAVVLREHPHLIQPVFAAAKLLEDRDPVVGPPGQPHALLVVLGDRERPPVGDAGTLVFPLEEVDMDARIPILADVRHHRHALAPLGDLDRRLDRADVGQLPEAASDPELFSHRLQHEAHADTERIELPYLREV